MKIYVIDDDRVARMMVSHQLVRLGHEVVQLESGEALLAELPGKPDLVLLDIQMPGIGGIAACRQIQATGEAPPVIFVSADDSFETRMLAFEVGGQDFIVKPYPPQELEQKVTLTQATQEKCRSLEAQVQYAQSTAFTVLSSLGEMGVALQFLKGSFSAEKIENLATGIFEALRQYDLRGLLEIRTGSGAHHFSWRGCCTSLESSVISNSTKMGRLFQFSDRLAINFNSVSLLVIGLPVGDEQKVGRLRDALAILVEGADARVHAMEEEVQRLAQSYGIKVALRQLVLTLADIEKSQADTRWKTLEINNQYLEKLTQYLERLGHVGIQEGLLIEMARENHDYLASAIDESYSIGSQLRRVINQLEDISKTELDIPPAVVH